MAALEGAVALAKFGQFDRAHQELQPLLAKDGVKVEAAKNILRCHLAAGSAEEAVSQYRLWHTDERFQMGQLEMIRVYLNDALQKKRCGRGFAKTRIGWGYALRLESDMATCSTGGAGGGVF